MNDEEINDIREAIGEIINIDIERVTQLEKISIDILNEHQKVDDILGALVEGTQNIKEIAYISLMAGLMMSHYYSDVEEETNQSMYI